MPRITGSYPDDLDLLIEGAVEAGVFGGKSDALREFVREYFEDHENERIQLRSPSTNASGSRLVMLRDLLMSTAGRCVIFSVSTA